MSGWQVEITRRAKKRWQTKEKKKNFGSPNLLVRVEGVDNQREKLVDLRCTKDASEGSKKMGGGGRGGNPRGGKSDVVTKEKREGSTRNEHLEQGNRLTTPDVNNDKRRTLEVEGLDLVVCHCCSCNRSKSYGGGWIRKRAM